MINDRQLDASLQQYLYVTKTKFLAFETIVN